MLPKKIKKTAIWLFYTVSSLLLLLLCYFLSGVGLSYITVNNDYVPAGQGIEIFIASNGVHTDFTLPVRSGDIDWAQHLPVSDYSGVDSSYRYISFGWGDRGFYLEAPTWDDLRFSTAFKAAFWLSQTAMHVHYRKTACHPDTDEDCRRLLISRAQYQQLIAYIKDSFRKDSQGRFVLIPGKGYYRSDNFYEAAGTYSFISTCNEWTNTGVKKMGIKAPLWSPFPGGLLRE